MLFMVPKRQHRSARNRNRSWDSPTHVWVMSTRLAGLVVLAVFGLIVYAVLQQHCKALNREIGSLEVEQRRLMEDFARERVRWTQLKTPRNLDVALHRHGIAMAHPSPAQIVHMEAPTLPGPHRNPGERPVYASAR